MKRSTVLFALFGVAACFTPDDSVAVDTEDGSSSGGSTTTATASMSGATTADSMTTSGSSTTDPTTSGTTTAGPTSSTDPSTTDTTDSSTTEVDPDSSSTTSEPQLGPQVVMSTPAADDLDAGLQPFFFVNFDRPISQADALGHVFVTQDGGKPVLVAPQPCPPDNDPTCIAGLFPASFYDGETNDLPGSTDHEIIIGADLPDLDGLTNTQDQVIPFRTFEYEANFFDDSTAISDELGGVVWDDTNGALFVAGLPDSGQDCILRRIGFSGGNPTSAATVATPVAAGGGPYCYGMGLYEDTILLTMTYGSDVRIYDDLTATDFNPGQTIITGTTLPAPHDSLLQINSAAQVGPRRFFSYGRFLATTPPFAILEFTGGNWSVFQTGQNLWEADASLGIATGSVGGTNYLFAHSQSGLYKFRLSDATLIEEVETPQMNDADLFVDDFGRLYVGSNNALRIYAATDLTLLEERLGLDTGRIGVDAEMDAATVYFARYRGDAVVGRIVVNFD